MEITAKSLVDIPEKVNVKEIEGEKTVVIELRVDKADLGKVIGERILRTAIGLLLLVLGMAYAFGVLKTFKLLSFPLAFLCGLAFPRVGLPFQNARNRLFFYIWAF